MRRADLEQVTPESMVDALKARGWVQGPTRGALPGFGGTLSVEFWYLGAYVAAVPSIYFSDFVLRVSMTVNTFAAAHRVTRGEAIRELSATPRGSYET